MGKPHMQVVKARRTIKEMTKRFTTDHSWGKLAEGPHVKGHERLPRDCKGLHNRTMETGLYAKYMTYRTASSDYGAYTLPSADNVGSLKPHMQVASRPRCGSRRARSPATSSRSRCAATTASGRPSSSS